MAPHVGVLYESDEWSDWKLRDELEAALGQPVAMVNMEAAEALQQALACDVLVSRVFASAVFRGHNRAAQNMLQLVHMLENDRLRASGGESSVGSAEKTPEFPRLINPPRAHRFEISKAAAARTLEAAGLTVPRVQALDLPDSLKTQTATWDYPCIIKPDCGGRTTHTAVLRSAADAARFLDEAPAMVFIVEDYIRARGPFMTRAELVDGRIALVVKRSIAPSGLSSYHEGSTYQLYPEYPPAVRDAVLAAATALDFQFGSFDLIEAADGGVYLIDANSVSNVSEDCTELFQLDLMKAYAQAIAVRVQETVPQE